MTRKAYQARPGNQNAVVTGAAGAEKRLSSGEPFLGVAAETLSAVKAEYQEIGLLSLIEERALRMQAVSDLYFSALLGAVDERNMEKVVRYTEKYGWLQASSIRALLALREARKGERESEPLDLSEYRQEKAEEGNA